MRDKIFDPLNREKTVFNTHTVEIKTRVGVHKLDLPDSDFLRNKPVVGAVIRSYHADRTTKNGLGLVSDSILKKSFLNLKRNSVAVIENFPLEHLVKDPGVNPGDYMPIDLEDGFDPTQSSIEITGNPIMPGDKAFEITFIYVNPDCQ